MVFMLSVLLFAALVNVGVVTYLSYDLRKGERSRVANRASSAKIMPKHMESGASITRIGPVK